MSLIASLAGKMGGLSAEQMQFVTAFLSGKPEEKQKVMITICNGILQKLRGLFEPLVERQEGETNFEIMFTNHNGIEMVCAVFVKGLNVRIDKAFSLEEIVKMIPTDQIKLG